MSATTEKPRVSVRDLGTLGYIHGLTHWAYKAGDQSPTDMLAPDYWDDASGNLAPGDWIFVSGIGWAMQLYVLATEPSVVVEPLTGTKGTMPC